MPHDFSDSRTMTQPDNEIDYYVGQMVRLHAGVAERETELGRLKHDLEQARSEVHVLQSRLALLEAETVTKDGRLDGYSRIVETRDHEIDRLADAAAALQGRLAERDAQLSALADALGVRDEGRRDLETRVSSLVGEIADRDEQRARLREQLDQRDERIRALLQDIRGLEQRARDAGHHSEAARTDVAQRDGERMALQKQLGDLQGELARAHEQIGVLKAQVAAQEARASQALEGLAAAQQSLSWRITRPLRAAANAGRRAIRGVRRLPDVRTYRRAVSALAGPLRDAADRIRAQGLIDTAFYGARAPMVDARRLDPLVHYLAFGAKSGIDPHPLFDGAHYKERYGPALGSESAPLLHYVTEGAAQGYDPHPLFDTDYYLNQLPPADLDRAVKAPLHHFLSEGAARRLNPHPLFDTAFYVERYDDVVAAGINPLVHYLAVGAAEPRVPHPLFDPALYLAQNTDVRRSGMNPLYHYVRRGAAEGRATHQWFDSAYYAKTYKNALRPGTNPLAHFLVDGWKAGYNPCAAFDTKFYVATNADVRRDGLNPLLHFVLYGSSEGRPPHPDSPMARVRPLTPLPATHHETTAGADALPMPLGTGTGRAPLRSTVSAPLTLSLHNLEPAVPSRALDGSRVVLCYTHVLPAPPRAGNEYRIQRLVAWLRRQGYEPIVVLMPLPGEEITSDELRENAREFGQVVLCHRDGRIEFAMAKGADLLAPLEGRLVPGYASALGEGAATDRERWLLDVERTFCPDPLVAVVAELQRALGQCVVVAEYVFMTRALPLLDDRALTVVDTHDVFSTKQEKVIQFGINDWELSETEERRCLARAQLLLAIQDEEQRVLQRLVPNSQVVTVGVDFDVVETEPPLDPRVLFVASGNPMNVKGVEDFLRFAWPLILREVPRAELVVAGRVSHAVPPGHQNVHVLGVVDDVSALYRDARVSINPCVAGTGLKIKTVDSFCHLRPIVGWRSGAEGLHPDLATLYLPADDWFSFARAVVKVLTASDPVWFSSTQRHAIRAAVSAEGAYGSLATILEQFFSKRRA
jgi:predicted  nucleic acid-binding Zn-ribbon protein